MGLRPCQIQIGVLRSHIFVKVGTYSALNKSVLNFQAYKERLNVVCTVFTFLKTQENGDDTDDEQENHPELRYGVYKNPIDGPSWRLEPGEYYNPA